MPVAAVGMPVVAGTWKVHNWPAQDSLVLPEVLQGVLVINTKENLFKRKIITEESDSVV